MGVGRPQAGTSKARVPRTAGGSARRTRTADQPRVESAAVVPVVEPSEAVLVPGAWDRIRGEVWTWAILGSTIAVQAATLAQLDPRIRGPIVLWFCLVCTGMVWTRLLRLDVLPEMVTGVALSVAISGLVAGVFLYSGNWSPSGTILVLQVLTLAGVLANNRIGNRD